MRSRRGWGFCRGWLGGGFEGGVGLWEGWDGGGVSLCFGGGRASLG